MRAVMKVVVELFDDCDHYLDHQDFVRHIAGWVEGGLYDRDDVAKVTITEQSDTPVVD